MISDLLVFAATLALGYAAVQAVLRLPLFPLREVVVTGSLREVSRMQIEYAAQRSVIGTFLTVNLESVRAACEKLPWVRKATVRRRWPNALEVVLEEHVAVARWRQSEAADSRLVNAQGEVFAASSNAALPLFIGPPGTAPQVAQRHAELTQLLTPLGRRPQVVALSPRQAWQARLDDGTVLDLGRDPGRAGVQERVRRYVAVQKQAAERLRGRAEVVDLRYPNGFAVRLARATEK